MISLIMFILLIDRVYPWEKEIITYQSTVAFEQVPEFTYSALVYFAFASLSVFPPLFLFYGRILDGRSTLALRYTEWFLEGEDVPASFFLALSITVAIKVPRDVRFLCHCMTK